VTIGGKTMTRSGERDAFVSQHELERCMPYTLLLHGAVIGETDFEHKGQGPRQQAGIFRPSPSGLTELPRITGMFAASLAFMRVVERHKPVDSEAAVGLLEDTPEGRKLIEHARVIEQLELRDPHGKRLEIESIAVSNLQELAALAASKLGKKSLGDAPPRYLISVTVRAIGSSVEPRRTLPAFGIAGAGLRDLVQ
jgi:hypothetical protein